jgi:hypothetical protein
MRDEVDLVAIRAVVNAVSSQVSPELQFQGLLVTVLITETNGSEIINMFKHLAAT